MTNIEIISIANIQQTIKKYELELGPFEGFFVSSVEFCKHVKFGNKTMIENIIKQEPKFHLELLL